MHLRPALHPRDLAADPDALTWYAAALDPRYAAEWLLRAAEFVPDDWVDICIDAAISGGWQSSPSFDEVVLAVADRLTARTNAEPVQGTLLAILSAPAFAPAAPRIGKWLARVATAGDAGVLADWLSHPELLAGAPDVRSAMELVLLERGSAELRRSARLNLAVSIAINIDAASPQHRELALRVLLLNEGARLPPAPSPWGPPPALLAQERERAVLARERERLLPIVERALGEGVDPSLACDVATAIGWSVAAETAFSSPDLPRVAAALVERIATDGESIEELAALSRCLHALFKSEHPLQRMRSPRAIQSAISVAISRSGSGDRERLGRWVATTAESWFDVHGLCRGDEGEGALSRLLTSPVLSTLVDRPQLHSALRPVLESRLARGAGPVVDVVQAILDAHPDDAAAVGPAVRSLPTRAVRLAAPVGSVSLDELTVELERIFLRSWTKPVAGVDVGRLVRDANRIELAALPEGLKYEIAFGVLRLDRDSVAGAPCGASGDTALALTALFIAHELVHGAQGFAHKDLVAALRATGGETTLMHIDLAADHAATSIVHEARRTWPLVWLKELQWSALRSFPVGPHHIAAARSRKLGRALSSRADYLIRRHEIVRSERLRDGYAFIELGPAGGKLLLLASGPPMNALGATELSADDATLLGRAADARAPSVAELDELLLRLLRSACTPQLV